MYAIVHISGVQTKVTPDEVLDVPRLAGEPGASLKFDHVLLVGDGEKIRIFKFKRRREYRRRRGHRDELTRIRVTAIKG